MMICVIDKNVVHMLFILINIPQLTGRYNPRTNSICLGEIICFTDTKERLPIHATEFCFVKNML